MSVWESLFFVANITTFQVVLVFSYDAYFDVFWLPDAHMKGGE